MQARTGVQRAVLWIVAVYLPFVPIFTVASAAYYWFCGTLHPTFSGCVLRDLWKLTPLILWAAYMSLLAVVSMHMRLFLPSAPDAVLTDLDDVGVKWIATVLAFFACVAVNIGITRVTVALDCVFLIIIVHVLAIWVRLVRTYGSRD
uniref:DUF7378 domain-containing protein n=1 Tax=Oryza punctata TaxID=4537 RepID=A0A0E0JEN0_ORYPU